MLPSGPALSVRPDLTSHVLLMIDLPNEHCNCMKLAGFQEERLKCCDSKCMASATEIISTIKRNRRDQMLRVFFPACALHGAA